MTKKRCKEIALMIWDQLSQTGNILEDDINFQLLYQKKITPKECQAIAMCAGNVFCAYWSEHLGDTNCGFCPLCNFSIEGCNDNKVLPFALWYNCIDKKQRKIYAQQIIKIIENWSF